MIQKTQKPVEIYPKSDRGWQLTGLNAAGLTFLHIPSGVSAISSTGWTRGGEGLPDHWEWLVSFSAKGGTRVSNAQLDWILKDWGLEEAEEDNHEPGIARKFFMAIDPRYRVPCE